MGDRSPRAPWSKPQGAFGTGGESEKEKEAITQAALTRPGRCPWAAAESNWKGVVSMHGCGERSLSIWGFEKGDIIMEADMARATLVGN